jgi:hypothetical protein
VPEEALMDLDGTPFGGDVWTEDIWERFLQQADARAARYQDLFETLLDHPDRDRLVAEEMGWTRKLDDCAEADEDCSECRRRVGCERYEMLNLLSEAEERTDDPGDDMCRALADLDQIPPYCSAHQFGLRMFAVVGGAELEQDDGEDLIAAMRGVQTAAAQIAGGHGIGYERDSISGNIANCKRAQKNIDMCVTSLRHLSDTGVLPEALGAALSASASAVAKDVADWIDLLRYHRDNPWDNSWLQQ